MMDLGENFPKVGHVNEVCKEWLVREDGALAYRLQSQEINEYYKGNKFRNSVVRQDFPTALNEQIKEKEIAKKQRALYHLLLGEQEEIDKQYAEKLVWTTEKIHNERLREAEVGEEVAKQLQDLYLNEQREHKSCADNKDRGSNFRANEPISNCKLWVENANRDSNSMNSNLIESLPFAYQIQPQPLLTNQQVDVADSIRQYDLTFSKDELGLSEPNIRGFSKNTLGDECANNIHMQKEMHIEEVLEADNVNLHALGLSQEEIDQLENKLFQERRDEELARKLQEQEKKELSQEEKDRLIAIETQDKELARMLQEREKAKMKRAKEKARLKRSQQKFDGNMDVSTLKDSSLTFDHDSYSNPMDMITEDKCHTTSQKGYYKEIHDEISQEDEIYAVPVDTDKKRPESIHVHENILNITRSNTSLGLECSNSVASTPCKTSSILTENDVRPIPPYMPIQGARRVSDGKKKKYKEKCSHQ